MMKNHFVLLLLLLSAAFAPAIGQVNYTANDVAGVPPYNGYYLFGSNMGYYGTSWDDKSVADIAAGNSAKNIKGAGVKTLRPSLYEGFLETWGYDIRINEFNHYTSLGISDNTVFLGLPAAPAHKDNNKYQGCADESNLFKNMYEPIWDGGLNGTPVNENNYYALYVYKTVQMYGQHVKFWEILNEPDLDGGVNGWKHRGMAGNWWENNPTACELLATKAPVFHYIRLLRISYEVIKTLDPTDYVTTGGIGYASYLEVLLRNTDNPVDGSVTAAYPNKGGAYFDCLSFHCYPIFDLAYWDYNLGAVAYTRQSDGCIDAYRRLNNSMDSVLNLYGYNGTTYPLKVKICTENNIPRKALMGYMGDDEAQKNYIIKAIVYSHKMKVRQMYIYGIGDDETYADAANPFHVMGLYQKLPGIGPLANGGVYNQQYNNEGIAYKTSSDILMGYRLDEQKTAAMNLPATIDGGAFVDANGVYVYVLWAKTAIDNVEAANATYSFPVSLGVPPTMYKKEWNYFITQNTTTVGSNNVALTASPVFLSANFSVLALGDENEDTPSPGAIVFNWQLFPNPAKSQLQLKVTLKQPATISLECFNASGQKLVNAIPSKKLVRGVHQLPVNIPPGFKPGIYYYQLHVGEKVYIQKVVHH